MKTTEEEKCEHDGCLAVASHGHLWITGDRGPGAEWRCLFCDIPQNEAEDA